MPGTTRTSPKKPLSTVHCAQCHTLLMTPHCDTCGMYTAGDDATYIVSSCPSCGMRLEDDVSACAGCGAEIAR